MLPRSAVPSFQEKIARHRQREETTDNADVLEMERNANFSRHIPRPSVTPSFADLLLGPEFDVDISEDLNDAVSEDLSMKRSTVSTEQERIGVEISASLQSLPSQLRPRTSLDWTVQPLPEESQDAVRQVVTLDVSVHAANGAKHLVTLSEQSISRLRGTTTSGLAWIDDDAMNGFLYLVNERSKLSMGPGIGLHKPSNNNDLFHREKVRVHIFGTHFFTIWKRSVNGGYESLRNWRRKVLDYNNIGMYMFPALIHENHWVLAIVDIDGKQFIYYDPLGSRDSQGVLRCAKQWLTGEVQSAERRDVLKGLDISKWPELYNPGNLPRQTDLESCGIFVIYVAEHIERGVKPAFSQSDIPVLRSHAVSVLIQGYLPRLENVRVQN